MSQPYPSTGQPAGPLQPPAPAPVLTAVKLMYAGAAVSAVTLIISLALIPAIGAALGNATPSLTAAQVSHVNILITLAMVFGLAVIAVWAGQRHQRQRSLLGRPDRDRQPERRPQPGLCQPRAVPDRHQQPLSQRVPRHHPR
jgi:hypothetical protein